MEMADSGQSEERYPLLFLFLDDGNKASRKSKNVFFERSRGQGIMSGATAVLTQWPAHLSSCGLMTVVLIMTIFFFFLMLLASTLKPMPSSLHPRCSRKSYDYMDTGLFLVHEDNEPWQQNQLDILEDILMKYTQCEVELLILRDEDTHIEEEHGVVEYSLPPLRLKRYIREQKRRHVAPKNKTEDNKLDLNINIGAKKLLKAFLERRRHLNTTSTTTLSSTTNIPSLPNLDDILVKFPKLVVTNMTKKEFFENGPLYSSWRNFNKETLNFAARILKLWENGGISFEIPYFQRINDTNNNVTNSTNYYKYEVHPENSTTVATSTITTTKLLEKIISPNEENKLLRNMINMGYSSFRNLPEGLVTVDEEGIHMETKTTCHAFFGEALVQLKYANNETTVAGVIRSTLKTFCVRGAVDSEYCNSV